MHCLVSDSCSTLRVPAGGNLTFSSDGKYTSVAFACEVGYTLDGARSLSCLSDGTWNAEPPTCGGKHLREKENILQ